MNHPNTLQLSQDVVQDVVKSIRESKLSIYDSLEQHPELRIATKELQEILNRKLSGLLLNQPIRTRSKVVKSAICEALGYPTPRSFKKTQPRFPGQDLDVYVQKSNNLQIWNEALSVSRRYVLVRVDDENRVTKVRVITGAELAKLDTTGTLTKKYQATAMDDVTTSRLVSPNDTPDLMWSMQAGQEDFRALSKAKQAEAFNFFQQLLPSDQLFVKLRELEGTIIDNPGADQERNRGWELHKAVSQKLGLKKAHDDGQVPDVAEQLLELKLQTNRTVDLGLMSPTSREPLEDFVGLHHSDIRYAVFYATTFKDKDGAEKIRIDHVVLTSGADFFCFFQRLKGNLVNTKNQIRLPGDFFDKSKRKDDDR